jgi:hypothetical protein
MVQRYRDYKVKGKLACYSYSPEQDCYLYTGTGPGRPPLPVTTAS